MSIIGLKRGSRANFPNNTVDGTMYYSTDTGELIFGNGSSGIKISDIEVVDQLPEGGGYANKFYYLTTDKKFYHYNSSASEWDNPGGGGGGGASSWNDLSGKPFSSIGTGLSVSEGVLSANAQIPAWSSVTSKPFASIGTGLTVTDTVLSADVQSVSLADSGTASSTVTSAQFLTVNNGTPVEVKGTKFMQQTTTTATSEWYIDFTNAAITNDSVLEVYTDVFDVQCKNISMPSAGTCRVTFPAQSTSGTSVRVRLYIM